MIRSIVTFICCTLVLALLVAGAFIGREAYVFLKKPAEEQGREVYIIIEKGETFAQVAEKLEAEGVITDALYFRLWAKWKEQLNDIQAGEFKLNSGWTAPRVLKELVEGKPVMHKLSLREGLTWWETGKLVEKAGYGTFEEFQKAVHDPALLHKYQIPFESAEGFLFPDTYHLPRPGTRDAKFVVELLLQAFWDNAEKVWPEGTPNATVVADTVILASLVEKETGVPAERERVAGVYTKRLDKGMLLQCDPTIIYGLGLAFDGNIRKKHIQDASNPYNTYQHPGLPPGPICSPGLAALKAATHPEEHDYLYFVAKGDGSHHFSKTLQEHNAAVRKYQLKK